LAEGSPDQVTINMRRVVENALNANASLVVLSHNHPSGVALPSKEDNQTTLQIKRALADIGVQLVDHVIVADGDFVCLRDNGLLD
jgi:DNA repair protein RadC